MKRLYIITGANGHLARTIIRALRGKDCLIRGLILPTESGRDDQQITYYKGDVTRPETLDAIFSDVACNETYVIHTAGIISIGDTITPQMYAVNVQGTRNVVAQCQRHPIARLVYVSSVHAIPEPDALSTISETRDFSPDKVEGAYAKTKAEATRLVLQAAQGGLNAVVVHPSGIVGPYDNGSNHMVQLVQQYLQGKLPAGVTGGYDFVDVRDVAQGCLEAAEKGRAGECYILSNRYCTVRELLACLRAAAGGPRKVCFPLKLAQLAAPLMEKAAQLTHTRPLFTRYSLHTMASNGHFTHDKATMELGYHPRDLKDTIADTVTWLRMGQQAVARG